VDPLVVRYPSFSPYVYVAANPIRLLDCDGRVIVDKKGAPVHISLGHDGGLTFSKNADQSTIRIANALALSSAGTEALVEMVDSPTKVHMNLSEASNVHLLPTGRYETVFGHTLQGTLDADDFGVFQNKDGTYGIREATITVFGGSLKQGIEKGSGSKYEGLTLEQAIGAAAGHESVHAVNKKEVSADKQYERTHFGRQRPEKEREQEPDRIQKNIIDEYKKKDQR
jgi:hypothetical protein